MCKHTKKVEINNILVYYDFFNVDHFLSLYWIYYNIASALSSGFSAISHVRYWLPDQRDGTCTAFIGRQNLNHWTAKEGCYTCTVCVHATICIIYIIVIWFPNSVIYLLSFYKYLSLTFIFLFDWWNQIVILYCCPVWILPITYLKCPLTLSVPCIFYSLGVTLESWSNWDSDLFRLKYFTSSHQGMWIGCYTFCVTLWLCV